MSQDYIIQINETQVGLRLDAVLAMTVTNVSRSKIQQLIKEGGVFLKVNDKLETITKLNYKVKLHEIYHIILPHKASDFENIKPLNSALEILFEDTYLMVINKPANLTVHPGAGNKNNTLVNILVGYLHNNLSSAGGLERRGIVHRLDKNTSGLLVIAKTDYVHHQLSLQFAAHSITRNYRALVWGLITPPMGEINNIIGRSSTNRKKMVVLSNDLRGKRAITVYKTLKVAKNKLFSLIDCELHTGRTHQIRVHLSYLKHPIVGDEVYGNNKQLKPVLAYNPELGEAIKTLNRHVLHAYKLGFIHPVTNKKMEFIANEDQQLLNLYELIFE